MTSRFQCQFLSKHLSRACIQMRMPFTLNQHVMPNFGERAISIIENGKKMAQSLGKESWPSLILQRTIEDKRRREEEGGERRGMKERRGDWRRGERRSHQHNIKPMKSINYKEHSSTDVEHDN